MILDFGSFARKGLMMDPVHPADTWGGGQSTEGKIINEVEEDKKPPTCMQWESDSSLESFIAGDSNNV